MSRATVVGMKMGLNKMANRVFIQIKNNSIWMLDRPLKDIEGELAEIVERMNAFNGSMPLKGWTKVRLEDGTVVRPKG